MKYKHTYMGEKNRFKIHITKTWKIDKQKIEPSQKKIKNNNKKKLEKNTRQRGYHLLKVIKDNLAKYCIDRQTDRWIDWRWWSKILIETVKS